MTLIIASANTMS